MVSSKRAKIIARFNIQPIIKKRYIILNTRFCGGIPVLQYGIKKHMKVRNSNRHDEITILKPLNRIFNWGLRITAISTMHISTSVKGEVIHTSIDVSDLLNAFQAVINKFSRSKYVDIREKLPGARSPIQLPVTTARNVTI